jgi:phospholipid/cholesterol/gamma-HCH transport system permease protein
MKPVVTQRGEGSELVIELAGDFTLESPAAGREKALDALTKTVKKCTVEAGGLGKWDTAVVAVVLDIHAQCRKNNITVNMRNMPDGVKRLIALATAVPAHTATRRRGRRLSLYERVGQQTLTALQAMRAGLAFSKDCAGSWGRYMKGKAVMRPIDLWLALEECGAKALPIVALISFMVGLIFAFVGAMQLKMFGAEIYVANLVAIAMVRVMGAVMTGIIMAGRTGAAYAATIGSMQVNEEIDALKTMGVRPGDFLLLPRMLALTLMMPLLTIYADFVGMLGGAAVGVTMLNVAPIEYWNATLNSMKFNHFAVGVTHGFVFGIIIALCGCYYGINSGRSADSVGKATTRAVVSSIVWIIVATAVLTLMCEVLSI